MKRLLLGGLVALGLALTAAPARADCSFQYGCTRHLCYTHTSKNRCFSFSSHPNTLPCTASQGRSGPAPWNALPAYGVPGYGAYPAPVAAVPAPAASTPSFKAPAPTPALKSTSGVQQAGYYYYGPTNNAGYGYNYGTDYGYSYYGYGSSYAQAPNYWY